MSNYALFPFGEIPRGSKIIIYGAGLAGKNMYLQIKKTNYCTVICMVDKNYKNIDVYELNVYSPEYLIKNSDYDYIVVSQMNEKIKHEIQLFLLNEIRVPEEKIVVPIDNVINWEYGFSTLKEELKYANQFPQYISSVSPRSLISSKRIDIAIRYLLFKDFVNRVDNMDNLSLFRRYTMIRTGGMEIETVHSPVSKQEVDEYVLEGKKLCESIKRDGFKKEGVIPVNDKGEALDGLHRIAASIVCDKDVMVHEYRGIPQAHVDFSYFEQNGFTWEDKIRILRGFSEIYPGKQGCLVLFYPCHDLWEYIEKQVGKSFNIVGKIDYDFESNYVGFENIIREIYSDSVCKNELIQRKLNALKADKLIIRFILINDEDKQNVDFYESLRTLKVNLRQRFSDLFAEVPIVMHTPDTQEEWLHLRNIFLSVNNISYMNRKTCQKYENKFIGKLNALKQWAKEHNIPNDDLIIVGSAVLEVFGLRESQDIDFTIMPTHRNRLNGDESYIISDALEITHRNFACDKDMNIILDEIIISDDNYHFYFDGLKFLNLELVRNKKKLNHREKDISDLRLIDLFLQWDAIFDDKECIRERIHKEMIRRKF